MTVTKLEHDVQIRSAQSAVIGMLQLLNICDLLDYDEHSGLPASCEHCDALLMPLLQQLTLQSMQHVTVMHPYG